MGDGAVEPPEPLEDDGPKGKVDGDNAGASAPGVAFVYDLTREEINVQQAKITEANTRLGFLLAAALTLATFYFKEIHDPWQDVLFGCALLVVLVFLLLGFVPRTHVRAPNPDGVVSLANRQPGAIKEMALGSVLLAFQTNACVLKVKNRFYALALVVGMASVLTAVGVKTYEGVLEWTHNVGQPSAGRSPTIRGAGRGFHAGALHAVEAGREAARVR